MRVQMMSAPNSIGPRALPRPRPGTCRDLGPVLGERIFMDDNLAKATSRVQNQCAVISRDMSNSFDIHPIASTMLVDEVINFLIAWVTVFSLALFVIGYIAYRRTGHPKLLAVSLAFVLYFIKGVVMALGLYYPEIVNVTTELPSILLDVVILLTLYYATVRA